MSLYLRVAKKEMEIQHFSHHHPLVFIQDHSVAALCLGCEKPVEGWSYGCSQCEFYLRKGCAELELAPQIQHPFHPKHPLTLLPKSPYPSVCDLCGKEFEGFVYNCYDCKFDLHINCALLQSSIAANFPNSLHPHLLFFIQNPNKEVEPDCSVCQKPISGPFYHCSDCTYPFNHHKECAELELAPQIQHPLRPKHTLTLFPESPNGGANCCNLCGKKFQGFAYNCGACQFDLDINCALLQSSIAAKFPNSLHPHPLFFIQNHNREVELDCIWCQKRISGPFYHCSDCTYPFKLHKECAELPLEIQHPFHPKHPLTLFPESLYPWDKNRCHLCCKEFRRISYYCGACYFGLHINCAFLQSSLNTFNDLNLTFNP